MQFGLVLAALLCFTTWETFANATQGSTKNCCLGWSDTRVPISRIVNYTIQLEGICPMRAVLLHTVLGKTLCWDPESRQAKKAIEKVDKDRKALLEEGRNEEGSTNDMTPAASMTSKNASKKRGSKGRRKTLRRGRKGQRKRA
uniref:Chemokine interleukin-8-like domain-containing protein n=1 Tax=Amphiprion percula TaxID=161767 RepID=A0A3P8THG0_AMPPE